jgi:hypothetical protein
MKAGYIFRIKKSEYYIFESTFTEYYVDID